MIAHFVRLLGGGVVRWFAASFVLFTATIYTPGGLVDRIDPICLDCWRTSASIHWRASVIETYKLDKPFLVNYVYWLLDPRGSMRPNPSSVSSLENDWKIDLWGVQMGGSGIFTGDWGRSLQVERDLPALDAYGVNFGAMLIVLLVPTLLLTGVAAVQRRGRSPDLLRATHERVWRRFDPIKIAG